MSSEPILNYLCGQWVAGAPAGRFDVLNPTTGEVIGHGSTEGLDLGAALRFARDVGGPALRALTFKQRGALLAAASKALADAREPLIDIAIRNGGNTRNDAKFDIDGATGTLHAYAKLGEELGERFTLPDGDPIPLGRSGRWCAQHLWSSKRGAAIHINAFNFPAWGMFEKAAVALLAGAPVVSKPAPSTSPLAVACVRVLTDAGLLPDGALQLLAGPPADLLDHLTSQDTVAFTGSYATACALRAHPAFVSAGAHLNVEADSVNAAVLAPDLTEDAEAYHLFINDLTREVTQKAGQKCTAIRRVFVPADRVEAVTAALSDKLQALVLGDPALSDVNIGPVNSPEQRQRVLSAVEALRADGAEVVFQWRGDLRGGDEAVGAFVRPTLLRVDDPVGATCVHLTEVFGPVATVMPYDGSPAAAAALVNRAGGGLLASAYTNDEGFALAFLQGVAPYHGRVYIGDDRCAAQSFGSGAVLPMLNHGGPGRAGGGSELGGVSALYGYMQKSALQGSRRLIDRAKAL
jgi:oxepin-CoA hydrolase/3-oxo-5,6-dehydrosuberyl-CoA semialdehyde dehydrogenase